MAEERNFCVTCSLSSLMAALDSEDNADRILFRSSRFSSLVASLDITSLSIRFDALQKVDNSYACRD